MALSSRRSCVHPTVCEPVRAQTQVLNVGPLVLALVTVWIRREGTRSPIISTSPRSRKKGRRKADGGAERGIGRDEVNGVTRILCEASCSLSLLTWHPGGWATGMGRGCARVAGLAWLRGASLSWCLSPGARVSSGKMECGAL